MVCGHCMIAPVTKDPRASHLRCRGNCECFEVSHSPNKKVRESQALYCHSTIEKVTRLDPGLDDFEKVEDGPSHRTTDEYRPNRNFIRVGDAVYIGPSRKGKRDGFDAVVIEFILDDDDEVVEVVVKNGVQRTVPIERLRHKTSREVRT